MSELLLLLFAGLAAATTAAASITALQVGTGRCGTAAVAWGLPAAALSPWWIGFPLELIGSPLSYGLISGLMLGVAPWAATACLPWQIAGAWLVKTERPPALATSLRITATAMALTQIAAYVPVYAQTFMGVFGG
ncbi:hypothetical protein [Alienimonas chondri]|uniref:Uncharacterized protein n=1 Tax=Alienimonas chondri TaxID=2681879 RepID=A0ABX1VEI1_9PLAN|nr:hypothetical protein [Alienimonas chondri]NNJ26514.1 hypothetical protein [Alienimonas chondri]